MESRLILGYTIKFLDRKNYLYKYMETIKLVDTHFAHAKYSTDNQESKYITWDRSPVRDNDKLVVYTDTSLNIVNKTVKKKIGWMLESPAITSGTHEWIGRNYSGFDMILTNNKKHIGNPA